MILRSSRKLNCKKETKYRSFFTKVNYFSKNSLKFTNNVFRGREDLFRFSRSTPL